MLFNHEDLKTLAFQSEYIDTAVIPVVPVDYSSRLMDIADKYEMIQYVTMSVESQFKGRLLLLPPVQIAEEASIIDKIHSQLLDHGFKYILFIVPSTMQINKENVFKINIMPLETMDDQMKNEFIQDNVKNMMKEIIQLWNK